MIKPYNITYKGKTIKCIDFSSLLEQYNYISPHIKSNIFGTPSEVNKSDEFYGKHKLSSTLEGLKYGFEDNTNYFLDYVVNVKNSKDDNTGFYMDYEGFAYDMGSVVNGNPECCLNVGSSEPNKFVKIIVDITFSCMATANQISNRGIAITNLINTLLLNKCIVDLYVMEYNIQNDMDVLYTVKIDTKNLSIANIAYISTPEYFRKIGFITVDVIRNKESSYGRGMSSLTNFMLNKIQKEKIFFIGGNYSDNKILNNLDNVENANKYIIQKFNDYSEHNKLNLSIDLGNFKGLINGKYKNKH